MRSNRITFRLCRITLPLFTLLAAASLMANPPDISGVWQGSRGENNPSSGSEYTVTYELLFTNQSTYREVAIISGTTVLDVTGSYRLQTAAKPDDPTVGALLTLQPGTPAVSPDQTNLILLVAASLPNIDTTQQWVGFSTLGSALYMTLQDVTARDTWGLTQISTAAAAGWQFIPVRPCRVVDTRLPNGVLSGPELTGGAIRSFPLPKSACGVPFTATAYSLNITAVPDGGLGYLTIWPTGQPQPNVSTLNSDGRVKANATIVPAGSASSVSVYVTDRTHVILDINGYFVPAGTLSALSFYPLPPCRVADTRNPASILGAPFLQGGVSRSFPIQSSSCSIPPTAQAYSLNVTVVPHGGLSYLSIWPSGQAQPVVSTLNASRGSVTANAAIVPAGNSGEVSLFATENTDVVLDVNGYFAAPASGGLSLYSADPCRLLDSRQFGQQGLLSGAYSVNFQTSSCAPSTAAQSYVLNATVIPATWLGYLSIWPNGTHQPVVSTLNASDGAIASNMAIVPTQNGMVDVFSSNPAYLLLDLIGYFAP